MHPNVISIDNVNYVREDSVLNSAPLFDGLECVIVRTYSAGVFYGYLEDLSGDKATILKSRRVWHWAGAASLSQLAIDGTNKPDECKFPEALNKNIVLGVIEIIPMTDKAKKLLDRVPAWKA